jgi:hypothetical protein
MLGAPAPFERSWLCFTPILLPSHVDGFLGRWTFPMTHLYLFFAELGMKSDTTGIIAVHRAVVQTLNIAL